MLHANSQQITTKTNGEEWQTVVFSRRKKISQKTRAEQIGESPATGINVRIFDASTDDFGFLEMIEVPAEGQSGGMVVMWNHEVVTVQNFIRRNQEIHAIIEY
ncbi:PREDICTED: uncharacterized protein LOC109234801 [Nicotiana attenuata]|uniref:uncharacterized protein LOC109234801 n=1 Tax=Nicotiana attenuata TaxID=49451 RepID=UPI0009051AF0|nr:PREDICTED: uncharacterized protein LOC109234801 [Nicotiana attenuata]